MSGECDKCGEHCLECICNMSPWIDVKTLMPGIGTTVKVKDRNNQIWTSQLTPIEPFGYDFIDDMYPFNQIEFWRRLTKEEEENEMD